MVIKSVDAVVVNIKLMFQLNSILWLCIWHNIIFHPTYVKTTAEFCHLTVDVEDMTENFVIIIFLVLQENLKRILISVMKWYVNKMNRILQNGGTIKLVKRLSSVSTITRG